MPRKNQETLPVRDAYFESAAMQPPGVLRAEVLGGIACHAASESHERIDDSGNELLNGMRVWLRESEAKLLSRASQVQKWRGCYPVLFDRMDDIHQMATAVNSESLLPDHVPGSLLANFLRYTESNNLDSELTTDQLTALYEAYCSDVQLWRDIKITDPERVAYRHGKQSLSRLVEKYGDFDFVSSSYSIRRWAIT
jgi:hypothetical protein